MKNLIVVAIFALMTTHVISFDAPKKLFNSCPHMDEEFEGSCPVCVEAIEDDLYMDMPG